MQENTIQSNSEIKEMIYYLPQEYGLREVLAEGKYNGLEYKIISFHSHPCAYICIPSGKKINVDNIECHGGITYDSDELLVDDWKTIKGHWIGWDYSHVGDYYALLPRAGGKQWKTEEILNEVKEIINQINEELS